MTGGTPAEAFTSWLATLHGLDPARVELRHDEQNDAWFLYLNRELTVRIDMKDDAATLNRNRDGLRKLIDDAMQLAAEIGERLAARDQAAEEDS